MQPDTNDPIRPAYYKGKGGLQPFDVIEAFDLGYHIGSIVAYLCRAGKKEDYLKDLKKAQRHLETEIELEEKRRAG